MIFMLLLACAGLTFTIKDSKVFGGDMLPVREVMEHGGSVVRELLACSFCLGFWCSLAVWFAAQQAAHAQLVVLVGAGAGVGIGCTLVATTWRGLLAGGIVGVFAACSLAAIPVTWWVAGWSGVSDAVLFGLAGAAASYLFDLGTLRLEQTRPTD